MKYFYSIIFSVLLLLLFPPKIFAETTNGCHCFKERAYKPQDRFAADDYILATSFNSLIANKYSIAKRQIVFFKMKGGVSHMDLIVALRVAKASGSDLKMILDMKKNGQTWQNILENSTMANGIKNDNLLYKLKAGRPLNEVGGKIADSLIVDFYKADGEVVKQMRSSGLNEKEMALVFIVANKSGASPMALAELYSKQGKSWSEIANDFGIGPTQAGKLILQHN